MHCQLVVDAAVEVEADHVLDVLPAGHQRVAVRHLRVSGHRADVGSGERLDQPPDRVGLEHRVAVEHDDQLVAGRAGRRCSTPPPCPRWPAGSPARPGMPQALARCRPVPSVDPSSTTMISTGWSLAATDAHRRRDALLLVVGRTITTDTGCGDRRTAGSVRRPPACRPMPPGHDHHDQQPEDHQDRRRRAGPLQERRRPRPRSPRRVDQGDRRCLGRAVAAGWSAARAARPTWLTVVNLYPSALSCGISRSERGDGLRRGPRRRRACRTAPPARPAGSTPATIVSTPSRSQSRLSTSRERGDEPTSPSSRTTSNWSLSSRDTPEEYGGRIR